MLDYAKIEIGSKLKVINIESAWYNQIGVVKSPLFVLRDRSYLSAIWLEMEVPERAKTHLSDGASTILQLFLNSELDSLHD